MQDLYCLGLDLWPQTRSGFLAPPPGADARAIALRVR